jgi:uncharacterized protein
MLFLLSPAKRLDETTPLPAGLARKATEPLFGDEAAALIGVLRKKSARQVAALMDLSAALAALNVERYAAWQREHSGASSRPAVWAFDGDVYAGLDGKTLSAADLTWAQRHLVILSGLYGALRPLDRIQPYRLEMHSALATPRGKDLYAWWGDTVSAYLDQRLAGSRSPVVVNLASQEYARVALRPALQARVVECVFEEAHAGGHRIVSFFAKRARGLMARWAVEQRAATPKALTGFDSEGYAFDRAASTADRLVFRRGG